MKTGYERTRERRGLRQELRAYITILEITIITVILLINTYAIDQLDEVMAQQRAHNKTISDCVDQLMYVRQAIDALQEPEIDDSSEVMLTSEEKDPVEKIITSKVMLTPEERNLVERIVASEARGEPIGGMMTVAQCIRDRSQLWEMTVTEVCLAPSQFAAPYQGEISPEVVQAVWAVFDLGISVFKIPTTHFHADYVSPYWAADKVSRGSIGAHLFYGE